MVTIEKIADLEYNELVALNIIEKDEDLCSMFNEDVRLPFSMLYRMSKEDSLNEDIKVLIYDFFEKIISTKKNYVEKYLRVLNSDIENLVPTKVVNQEIPEVIEDKIIKKVATKPKTTTNKTKELPKWYGKSKVLIDIEAQGGVATAPQLGVISINDIHNIYLKMTRITINDMLTNNRILTDEEYRKVKAINKTYSNQMKAIFKNK